MSEKEKWKFRTSWGAWKKFGFFIMCVIWLFIFVMILVSVLPSPSDDKTNLQPNKVAVETTNVVFDINSLYDKDILEIRSILWTPTDKEIDLTEEQTKLSQDMERYNTFAMSWYGITVTYKSTSHTVVDLFITDWTSLSSSQCDVIMKKFNITDWKNFSVKKVKELKDDTKYTGITLTPIK